MKQDRTEAWVAGHLALTLLAVDPGGLGGLHLRARSSPAREAFLASAPAALRPFVRIAPTLPDDAVFGGTDIAESLVQGRLVSNLGLMARAGTRVLSMAERTPRDRAARLAQRLDHGGRQAIILIDEGIDEEIAPAALRDRLAFHVDLDGLRAVEMSELAIGAEDVAAARALLPSVALDKDAIVALTVTAARFGITSMRAPMLALAAARAHAALDRRECLHERDLRIATELVFAHRATELPDVEEDMPEEPPEDRAEPEAPEDRDASQSAIPDEMLIEAVRALLPEGALRALTDRAKTRSPAGGSGAGRRRRGNRRGRPLPAVQGMPSSQARLDLIATLRAAAPWQQMRRAAQPERSGVILRASDFRVRVYEERSDRLVIFVVDASGSAAMARLAEAKGAVEHLLADAYASRDHVALVAFRGEGAEVLLPPTRALVQAKRALGGLPGGGGTPLAAGLKAATEVARHARAQGLSPSVALLTDGRANVGLEAPGRAPGLTDAAKMARLLGAMGLPGLVLDTNARPRGELAGLAAQMGATYLPLPRADAAAISRSVRDALGD